MTEQELKRLNRAELLEIVLLQSRENEELKEQVSQLKKKLEDKTVAINESGNLAEASLRLNRVFDDAEAAVAQYKENIKRMSDEAEAISGEKIATATQQAAELLNQAKAKAEAITATAEKKKLQAEHEAELYWKDISQKIDKFLNAQAGLRELLNKPEQRDNG